MVRTRIIYLVGIVTGILSWVDWFPGVPFEIVSVLKDLCFVAFIGTMALTSKSKLLSFRFVSLALILFYFVTFLLSRIHGVQLAPYHLNYVILSVFLSLKPQRDSGIIDGYLLGGIITVIYMLLIGGNYVHLGHNTVKDLHGLGLPEWFLTDSLSVARMGLTTKYNKLSYMFAIGMFFLSRQKPPYGWIYGVLFFAAMLATGGRGGLVVFILYLIFIDLRRGLVVTAIGIPFCLLVGRFLGDLRIFNFNNDSSQLRLQQVTRAIKTKNVWIGDNGFCLAHFEHGFSHVHNFFLNTYFNGGLIASAVGLLVVGSVVWTFRELKGPNKVFFFALLFAQLSFENFNMVLVLSAYLPVWYQVMRANGSIQ